MTLFPYQYDGQKQMESAVSILHKNNNRLKNILQVLLGRLSSPRPADNLPDTITLNLSRVGVGVCDGKVRSLVNVLLLHSVRLQSALNLQLLKQNVQSNNWVSVALGEGFTKALLDVGAQSGEVVCQSVGKNDGVGLGVGKVESSTKSVAELVVKGHSDGTKAGAAQPSSVKGELAGLGGGGVLNNLGKGNGERPDSLKSEEGGNGVGVGSVEGLDGVRNGVNTRGRAHSNGEGHGEVNIVDDGSGKDLGVGAGLLDTGGGLSQNRGHLRSGIGGGDTDVGKSSANAHGLSKSNGRTSSNGDQAVGGSGLHELERLIGDLGGCVHSRAGEDSSDLEVGEEGLDILGLRDLLGGAENERLGEVLAGELLG